MAVNTVLATAAGSEDHRRWQPGASVFACKYDGGTALLSVRAGKYFTLNEAGSALWERLTGGLTIEEAARSLATDYEISLDAARHDAAELLTRLSSKALIEPRVNRHSDAAISATTRQRPLSATDTLRVPSLLRTWLTLIKFHVLLKVGRLTQIAEPGLSVTSKRSATVLDPRLRDALNRRVRTAAAWLPFQVACLAQSLTVIEILRRHGLDATLRVGIYPYPFSAHAWAECGGQPVNELPEELLRYRAITS